MTCTVEPRMEHRRASPSGGIGGSPWRRLTKPSEPRRPSHRGVLPRPMRTRTASATLMGLVAGTSRCIPASVIVSATASVGAYTGRRAAPAGDGNAAGRIQPHAAEPAPIPAQQWGRTGVGAEKSASWSAPCARFSFNGARPAYGKRPPIPRRALSGMLARRAWRRRQNVGPTKPGPCAARMHRPVQAQTHRLRVGSRAANSPSQALGIGCIMGVGGSRPFMNIADG